ncbi:chaplin [Streptomyces sp. CC208A]|uniref:chaplin n=1 Tax=Streptomyces sp. CC208A TaxID=3044573 RepID=UPI0024A86412|nr:chaplin [Streptomyces sp. CC208A]
MVRVRHGLAVALAASAVVVGGASMASADAGAQGVAAYSPGVGSGNLIQVPIHIPVNACGNTVSVIGLLNPSFGNTCVNA